MTSCLLSSFWRQASLSLLLCAAAVVSRTANAEPAPADLTSAKQAFESAVKLEGERHWAEAALKLRQAIAVKDTPGLRFHLAHCEVEQGHLVEASLEYDRVNELLAQGAKAPDVQQLLGPARDGLKSRIPRLTVELPPDLSAPNAAVDGKAYPPSELALGVPLNPGRHALRVVAAGRRPFEQVVLLQEGQPTTVRPKLAVAPPPAAVDASVVSDAPLAPPPQDTSQSASPRRPAAAPTQPSSSTKLYLLIGESVLTAAGLGLRIGGQFAASSATDRVTVAQRRIDEVAADDGSACVRPELNGACSDLRRAISDHDDALVLSEIGFISAGVGAAALVTTWFVYPDSSRESSGLRVHPVVSLGRIGVLGSF